MSSGHEVIQSSFCNELLPWMMINLYCEVTTGMARWRHQMEAFSSLLALCVGNSPVTGEFPSQRPVTRSFDVFFDLRLNKALSKQSWGWWFETPPYLLWRHCNVKVMSTSAVYSNSQNILEHIVSKVYEVVVKHNDLRDTLDTGELTNVCTNWVWNTIMSLCKELLVFYMYQQWHRWLAVEGINIVSCHGCDTTYYQM